MDPQVNIEKRRTRGKIVMGLIIVGIGSVMLLRELGTGIPEWIISWPMILVVIGTALIAASEGKKAGGFIVLIIGLANLPEIIYPMLHIERFVWPVLLIGWGIYILFFKKSFDFRDHARWNQQKEEWRAYKRAYKQSHYGVPFQHAPFQASGETGAEPGDEKKTEFQSDQQQAHLKSESLDLNQGKETGEVFTGREFLNETCFMGGVSKTMFSKNFGGGDITAIFGGAEIDLTHADIQGEAILDLTLIFGGAELIIPAHWQVVSEMTAILGGIDDKRQVAHWTAEGKKLIIKGTAIFGGLEIHS